MRVGIVGTGNMGSKYIKKFEILGYDAVLIDKEQSRLKDFPERFKKYTDIDEALKNENIDFLFVATDPVSHIPIAKKALERGINVMVEKPPSIKPSELEDAINFAYKNNAVLEVSEIELRSNSIRNLDIGSSVDQVQAYRLNLGRGYINPFYDLAWHDLYIFSYLFGEFSIKSVKDKGDIFDIYGETEENEFFLQVAWSHDYLRREWILRSKEGEIKLNFVEDRIEYPSGKVKEKDNIDKLELMIKQFVQNPSFESSFRALNILKEFDKFRV
ncbi:MAG TPA: gfo/Idh/MocA family oxidoreductase [Persephonella sp.]|uniref:Oxidoreductase family, NAD-binding Rossmann fold protein n=1 Tax=Persephonella marina (strain DSM 14350 / EX-H1) TaxID=123214 RepID=C0QT42_PERMH|nr:MULTISPECIES: Gfo/Idh/MocA family oxidoreductase [Persephonella]ACO03439.1 oxidoreductase family, NAD-binding Rossmann fold protein [Persephonella marina EX-H1]HCB70524.1 gfo/Idh/MocA family oxidoreductase [Persephonella sp.]